LVKTTIERQSAVVRGWEEKKEERKPSQHKKKDCVRERLTDPFFQGQKLVVNKRKRKYFWDRPTDGTSPRKLILRRIRGRGKTPPSNLKA